jgi:uncharacterized protein YndB with AHSA1/START domain
MNATATAAYVEPVFKSARVRAAPAKAFEVFTAGMSRWWNPAFSINPTKAPIAGVVLEPRVGGRWYEKGADGTECDWGRVLVWDSPRRLVLDWQVDSEFRFNPELHTEVEVRFKAAGAGETEVTLEHRHLGRLGAMAAPTRARLDGGWGLLLDRFGAALL